MLELIAGTPAVAVDAPMRTPTVDIHPAGTVVIRQDPFCIHKVHRASPLLYLRLAADIGYLYDTHFR